MRNVVTYVLRALRRLYGDQVVSNDRQQPGGRQLVERLGAAQRLGAKQQQQEAVAQRAPTRFNFTTVHVRIENDFRGHCAHFSKIAKRRCFFKEEEVASLLRDTYQVPPGVGTQKATPHAAVTPPRTGSLLQVASGEPLSSMPVLCSVYRCFRALDIWQQGNVKGRGLHNRCN